MFGHHYHVYARSLQMSAISLLFFAIVVRAEISAGIFFMSGTVCTEPKAAGGTADLTSR
jgi:hypothetical protein